MKQDNYTINGTWNTNNKAIDLDHTIHLVYLRAYKYHTLSSIGKNVTSYSNS